MKLSYFELLSSEPVRIPEIGGIVCPTLRQIAALGHFTYQYYLAVLSMDTKGCLDMLGKGKLWESLAEEEKCRINVFDLFLMEENAIALLQNVLNFFIRERVEYSAQHKGFIVTDDAPVGLITGAVYPQVCELICQRCGVSGRKEEDLSKAKDKKALEIIRKLQKGRAERAKHATPDANMELGNIISAVANRSYALNMQNIWDLTVFQLWDSFYRLYHNTVFDIQSMSVAAWGSKDHNFDAAAWYKMREQV